MQLFSFNCSAYGQCCAKQTFCVACRQTIFLPVVGLVDPDTMKPGDLVGVNKDSYLILDTLPSEYDSRVKAMEVRRNRWHGDLYCTVLYCTVLYCTVLYCTVLAIQSCKQKKHTI